MKFLRQDHMRFSKLGKKRKKLQKWRKPKGRHSKMRQNRQGYPASPGVGYKKSSPISQIIVHNLKELEENKNTTVTLARVGARKKLELIKKAEEMKIKLTNLGAAK